MRISQSRHSCLQMVDRTLDQPLRESEYSEHIEYGECSEPWQSTPKIISVYLLPESHNVYSFCRAWELAKKM